MEAFMNFTGPLATMGSVALVLGPSADVWRIFKTGKVSMPFLPLASMLGNGSLGLCYGLVSREPAVIASGSFGSFFPLVYCLAYISACSEGKGTNIRLVVSILALAAGLGFAASTGSTVGEQLVTTAMLLASTLVFAAPLIQVRQIVRESRIVGLSLPMTIANLFCGVVWYMHCLKIDDLVLCIPNLLGVLCCCLQLCLFLRYDAVNEPPGRLKKGSGTPELRKKGSAPMLDAASASSESETEGAALVHGGDKRSDDDDANPQVVATPAVQLLRIGPLRLSWESSV